ncbi:hypothetical protein V6N13_135146 [Hibiscus sabdariffa]
MQRIAKKQSQAEKFVGPLCPKIQMKLEIMIELSNRCWPRNAGGQQYQVECGYGNQHVVNMQALTCTCRRWELTGSHIKEASSIEQSQTAIQPPRTTLLKQPCQPRQKQPIKRKEPVVHHDSKKKQPSRMPSNTQDSTATTQDTPRSNVTNTRVD